MFTEAKNNDPKKTKKVDTTIEIVVILDHELSLLNFQSLSHRFLYFLEFQICTVKNTNKMAIPPLHHAVKMNFFNNGDRIKIITPFNSALKNTQSRLLKY